MVQRYDHWSNARGGGVDFKEDESGVFVFYSDYAKLEAELATAKQRIEKLERYKELTEPAYAEQIARAVKAERERDRLEQENKRLKAPVTVMEWSNGCPVSGDGFRLAANGMTIFDRIIAARTEQEKPCVCHEVGCPFCDPQQEETE